VGGSQQLTESQRNETLGRLTWSKQNVLGFQFEAGGEAALNTLDYHQQLFVLEEGGEKMPIELPIQDARVKENRGEVWVNGGRLITKNLRMDAGLNFEFSHLTVTGDASADRKLKFLKPSITLDWQAPHGWHSQFILRRTVAQLDFFDFVSSADLSVGGRVNGGNADLQPQRTWETRFVLDHPVFKTGEVRLELGYDLVSLLQDRILVFDDQGNAFDAPGNLGTGRRTYADLTFDAPLDQLWHGLHVKLHANVQRTRVDDPITNQPRSSPAQSLTPASITPCSPHEPPRPFALLEGAQSRDRAAHDEGVNVVGALVGVDRLEVRGVAHDLELRRDAVSAVHVTRDSGDIQRLAAIVPLNEADRLGN
jgi:hypothetical protein